VKNDRESGYCLLEIMSPLPTSGSLAGHGGARYLIVMRSWPG